MVVEKPHNTDLVNIAHQLDDETKKRTADVLPDATSTVRDEAASFVDLRFADLSVSPAVLRGLEDAGFVRPSPVQVRAIPLGRMGLDLIVQAKSGTGKTVVFVVVVLESIDVTRPVLQALVLSPTREIALQSQLVFQRLGAHLPGLNCQLFVGGLPLADDIRHLQGCHIAVGTPGRVRYLIETGYMAVSQVRHLVLDEADLLLAGGADAKLTGGSANNAFPADVNYIWWSLPETKQVMALSATYSDFLAEQHLHRYMNNPATVRLASFDPALLGVRQFFSTVHPTDRSPASVFAAKVASLCKLLSAVEFQQCLIFSNFHSSAQELCNALHSRGWPVAYISSSLDQNERFRAFNRLRSFHCRVLVSTDLTSRGIDAENVNLVVSLEVPWEHPTYLHRVGRAGRFGSYGASVLIVADIPEEQRLFQRLQSSCPTSIVQLPDPVPADLAAPDCPIDWNSLVTVTSCGQIRDSLVPSPRPKRTAKTKPKVERPHEARSITTKPTPVVIEGSVGSHAGPLDIGRRSEWYSLSDRLSDYLSAVYIKPDGPITEDYSNWLNTMESGLIEQIANYYEAGMPSMFSPITHDPQSPVNRPRKEPSKHVNPSVLQDTTGKTTGTDQSAQLPAGSVQIQSEPYQWTEHRVALWNEYCSLLQYARAYYAAWESAAKEYESAVERLSRALSSDSNRDIVQKLHFP